MFFFKFNFRLIEIINNKARHNLIDAKCRWRSDRLDGAGSFWEPLGQMQVMQIRQGETPKHQEAITHEVCCLSCQWMNERVQSRQVLYLYDAISSQGTDKVWVRWGTLLKAKPWISFTDLSRTYLRWDSSDWTCLFQSLLYLMNRIRTCSWLNLLLTGIVHPHTPHLTWLSWA